MVHEDDLIRLAQQGQVAAFEALVERHQARVYSLALRLTGNRDDAFDMAQEALLKAFLSLPAFRGQSSFSTWLHRITTNVCLDEMRRRGRRPLLAVEREDEDAPPRAYADPSPGPEAEALRREERRAIERAIAALPEEFRVPLVLRDLQGFSYEEIAELTGLPLGTVKSRIHRARLQLRDRLTPELFPSRDVSAEEGGRRG